MAGLDPIEATRRELLAGCTALMAASHAQAGARYASSSGARGFDFLIGSWSVRHRRLKQRLANSHEWEEFPGTLDVRPILHGLGNVDENVLEAPKGRYLATSLRVFDRQSGKWSVYWVDGRGSGLDKPVVGQFRGRIARLYNDDEFDGRPIKVRATYRDLGVGRANWDQAFSVDGGRSWEINWIMEFTRKGEIR